MAIGAFTPASPWGRRMKHWQVETRAIVRRYYYVDAEDEKSAEAASCDTTCDHEEDTDEETLTITEIVTRPMRAVTENTDGNQS
jgi:hypothetical protein